MVRRITKADEIINVEEKNKQKSGLKSTFFSPIFLTSFDTNLLLKKFFYYFIDLPVGGRCIVFIRGQALRDIIDSNRFIFLGSDDVKISDVEQLTGLPKKTIKYYEEEELVTPERNSSNSYREYGDQDIIVLRQIKLLRKLGLSIETIKSILSHPERLRELLQNHIQDIDQNINNLGNSKRFCLIILSDNDQSNYLDSVKYLELMVDMEKEGYKFMDENAKELQFKKDNRKTILFVVSAAIIVLCAGIFLLPLNELWKILLFAAVCIGLLVFLVSWHTKKVAYSCKECHGKFVIGFFMDLLSPQLPPDSKYLKCPHCGKRTWAKETHRD